MPTIKLKTDLELTVMTEDGQSFDVTLFSAANPNYEGSSVERFLRCIAVRVEHELAAWSHRRLHAPPPAGAPESPPPAVVVQEGAAQEQPADAPPLS